jgi:1-acyl-sn-glycerol-3-phosphate acyltransferase
LSAQTIPVDPTPWRRRLFAPWCLLVLFPFVIVATVVFATLAILGALISRRVGFHSGTVWAWLICQVAFIRVRVRGREHVDPNTSYVILANHQGMVDIVALYGYWRNQFRWVMKQELRKVPAIGASCAALGFVFVDRSNPRRAYESLEKAKPELVDGVSVLFFPEGTRSPDGGLLPFKKGGFQMARQLGLPILPVSISGSWAIAPRGTVFTVPGTVDLTFHPPVDPAAFKGAEAELIATVRTAILSGLAESERARSGGADVVNPG